MTVFQIQTKPKSGGDWEVFKESDGKIANYAAEPLAEMLVVAFSPRHPDLEFRVQPVEHQ